MKKTIKEEISRTKKLMGILNESLFDFTISCPINCDAEVTSEMGWRVIDGKKKYHEGIDLRCESGTDVKAVASGEVVVASLNVPNCGGMIQIKHSMGIQSKFCHLSQINVTVGQEVKKGDIVGKSGGTPGEIGSGHSTGPHLHFEMLAGETPLNPKYFLELAKQSEPPQETEAEKQDKNWIENIKSYAEGLKTKSKKMYDDFMKYKVDGIPMELYILGVKKKVSDSLKNSWEEIKIKFDEKFIPMTNIKVSEILESYGCLSEPGRGNIYKDLKDSWSLQPDDEIENGGVIYYKNFWHPEAPITFIVIKKNDTIKIYNKKDNTELFCE